MIYWVRRRSRIALTVSVPMPHGQRKVSATAFSITILRASGEKLAAAQGATAECFNIFVPVGQSLSTCPSHTIGMNIKKSIRVRGKDQGVNRACRTCDLSFVMSVLMRGRKCLCIKPPQRTFSCFSEIVKNNWKIFLKYFRIDIKRWRTKGLLQAM